MKDTEVHRGYYQGWKVTCDTTRPTTSTWVATRFGVEVCAATQDAIIGIISYKNAEVWKPN